MALAAVAAASTFTGCGGNNSENRSTSYVSAKKFAGGAVTIYSVNTRSLEIKPMTKLANSGQYKPAIEIPSSTTSTEDGYTYETTESALCTGTIGVRGGMQYEAEFLYLVSGEEVGCVQPIVTSTSALSDAAFLNACGYLSDADINDSFGHLLNTSANRFERLVAVGLGSFTLRVLLNFKTQRMTIITSGSGFTVTYYGEDNDVLATRVLDEEHRTSNISFPYIVESR